AARASSAPPRLDPSDAGQDQRRSDEKPGRQLLPKDDPGEERGENGLEVRRDRDLRRFEIPEGVHPQRVGYHRGADREIGNAAPDAWADGPERRHFSGDEERREAED